MTFSARIRDMILRDTGLRLVCSCTEAHTCTWQPSCSGFDLQRMPTINYSSLRSSLATCTSTVKIPIGACR